jgi:D,D-heptose 1,7-bisphosphate phosphatase
MPPATIRQCAVLVGGLGTRLGALTADTPKPLLPVCGRPFLAWLLRELCRFGVEEVVLLAGFRAERVEEALEEIAASLPRPLRIRISREPEPCGTGGALHLARDLLDERFLLCNGDSLLAANLARLLADASADNPTIIGRMALRAVPDASRYGVVERDGGRVTAFRPRPDTSVPGIINAGIYRFDRRVLDRITPRCSLEADILPVLAAEGALGGTVLDGYFIDIGIPADLARARDELATRLTRPALFLDRDGVINHDHGWVGTRERFDWMPGIQDAVRDASDAGWHVFVVTNQSGIARGHYNEADLALLHGWMQEQFRRAGGTIDDIRFCPYHPEAALPEYRRVSDWRKPAPGMITDLIRAWQLDPARCILVGDQPTDLAAAEAAGIAARRYEGSDIRRILADARQAIAA